MSAVGAVGETRGGFGPMGTPGQIDQPGQHFEENGEIEGDRTATGTG
ncbi:MAG TPA: hypothetical protein V6D27_11225 [Vampirovibrionales bacterium]